MNCPFLRETQVRHCRLTSFGKVIPHWGREVPVEGRCTKPDYVECLMYRDHPEGDRPGPPCPMLEESLVQYCAASPVTKFVPYTSAVLSRCVSGAFRYCDLYLDMTHPGPSDVLSEDTIPLAEEIFYTNNHWWVELASDGPCHIGVDAFLARMFGEVDRIEYLVFKGLDCPSAVFTAQGTDFQTSFPEPVYITGYNSYLRRNPVRLAKDPYTRGWLFECTLNDVKRARLRTVLMDATQARAWLDGEVRRVNERLQQAQQGLAADGGVFTPGLLRCLERKEAMRLFHEFGARRIDHREGEI